MNETKLLTDEELYDLISGKWRDKDALEEKLSDSGLYVNGCFTTAYLLSSKILNKLSKETVKGLKSNNGCVNVISDGIKTNDDPIISALMGNILDVALDAMLFVNRSDIRCFRYTNVQLIRSTNDKSGIFKLIVDIDGLFPVKVFSRVKSMKHKKVKEMYTFDHGKLDSCYEKKCNKSEQRMNSKLKKLTGKNDIIKEVFCDIKCIRSVQDLIPRKTTYDVVKRVSDKGPKSDRGGALRPILFKTNMDMQSTQLYVKIKDQLPVSLITGKKLSTGNVGKSDLYPEYDYINPKEVVWVIPNDSVMIDLN